MKDRCIVRRGRAGIVDAELIGEVYGLRAEVIPNRGVREVVSGGRAQPGKAQIHFEI